MVAGDLIKFKFKYETSPDVFIYPGDLGIVKSSAMWYIYILHLKTGKEILLKKDEIQILELQC